MTFDRSIAAAESASNLSATDAAQPPTPFALAAQPYGIATLRVIEPSNPDFFMLLGKLVTQAPQYYRHAPVVLDLSDIADRVPFNMAEFCRRLRQHQLHPAGIVNGSPEWERVATNAGLGVFRAEAEPEPAPSMPASDTRYLTEPVRSGQQVGAQNGDLVVLGAVSHGSELMADGCIHVYGTLRGRALAGMSGDVNARIFCRNLDPELISIAGYYMVREDIDEDCLHKPAQIRLEGERLVIEAIP